MDQNEFLEFLQMEAGEFSLVTKSELVAAVRERGFAISDRQLTFYVSEGLLPRSVRVGSRAGAYPRLVISLLTWILRCREMGVPVDAIKELLPVWKYVVRARRDHRVDLAELEYVARQHLDSFDAVLAVPELLTEVLGGYCPNCRRGIVVVAKDGRELALSDAATTIGFAAARRRPAEDGDGSVDWWGYRRIALSVPPEDYGVDATTVVLGVKPNEPLPPPRRHEGREALDDAETDERVVHDGSAVSHDR